LAKPETIVFIHGGAIGDLVQALPAMAAVRAAWPQAAVTLIGRPERAALAVLAGAAETIVDLETCGLWRRMGKAAREAPALPVLDGAGLVVDLFTKGRLAARAAKRTANGEISPPAPAAPGLGRDDRGVVSVDPLPPEGWDRSAATWILNQVRESLRLSAPCETPVIRLPQAAEEAARGLLESRGVETGFVAIHPGSGSTAKNWPADRFEAVARRIRSQAGRRVVWLAGPAEQERGTLPHGASGEAVLADLTLVEVAGVLALADAYLGNDSGITQMAAAVRRPEGRATPTVAVFGPTDPKVWAPRGEHVRVIAAADGTMEGIRVETAWKAVRAVLIRQPAPHGNGG